MLVKYKTHCKNALQNRTRKRILKSFYLILASCPDLELRQPPDPARPGHRGLREIRLLCLLLESGKFQYEEKLTMKNKKDLS